MPTKTSGWEFVVNNIGGTGYFQISVITDRGRRGYDIPIGQQNLSETTAGKTIEALNRDLVPVIHQSLSPQLDEVVGVLEKTKEDPMIIPEYNLTFGEIAVKNQALSDAISAVKKLKEGS